MATTIIGGGPGSLGSGGAGGGGLNSPTAQGGAGGNAWVDGYGGGGGGAGVTGGNGGAGAGGGGSGGMGGSHGYFGALLPGVNVQGGNGGNGGDGSDGGGGGGGGYGAVITGTGNLGSLAVSVSGGAGGNGGAGSFGGVGGNGGVGLYFAGNAPTSVTLTNAASVTGGQGGSSGFGFVQSSGGIGIIGSDLTLNLAGGSISGGGGNAAIWFETGTNTFEYQSGTVTGNVYADGTNDTFRIAGTTGGNYNLSTLSGFEHFESTNSATWTVTGSYGSSASWSASSGTLIVNATMSATVFSVGNGATLGGSGTVGDVTIQSGGSLSAGNSPGTLTTGDLTLSTGATFTVEIQGTSPGAGGYDQVVVNGSVSIDGAILSVALLNAFNYTAGTTFTIIDNDGTVDLVDGTFAGLAQNAVIVSGNEGFRISYKGGDGNDVVLTNVDAEASSLVVTTNLDVVNAFDGVTSLREAVTYANNKAGADTITFDADVFKGGTDSLIRLTQGEIEITEAVTIDGSTGKGVTITGDRNGNDKLVSDTFITNVAESTSSRGDNSRIFNITTVSADTTLQGLTLTGGFTTDLGEHGGAIRSFGAVTLIDSLVSGNSTAASASNGGGIFSSTVVTLTNSTVSGNSTGGDIANGGGIYGNTVMLTNSTVSGNSTGGDVAEGGGIYGKTVMLTNSTVSGNSTAQIGANGGGIYGVSVTLTNSTVSGNSTAGIGAEGGGISGDTIKLTNSTVSGNSTAGSSAEGGGIYGDTITLTNSTVSGNSTAGSGAEGGGIMGDTVTLTNSLVLGNDSAQTSFDEAYFLTSLVKNGVNIVGKDVFSGSIDVSDTSADAVFAQVTANGATTAGVLANNGGPVQTIALLASATNPALDAAVGSTSTAGANGVGAADQTGVGKDGTGPTVRDLGAYEAPDFVKPTVTIDVADTSLLVGETTTLTFTFSEKVTKFENGDLAIDNGSLANVASSDGGLTWTATFTPTANIEDASSAISLDLSKVEDLAGNAGTGTTASNTYAVDTKRPTATIVVADTALSAGETSLVTMSFSEKVKNFANADLTVENGTLSAVTSSDGGKTWTATFTQALGVVDPSNVIMLNLAGVSDLAGNVGVGTVQSNSYALLNDAPTAVVASNVRGPIAENASTAAAIKFADLDITDVDGGTNVLSLAGADASLFQILNGDLYLKAGAKLDFETNPKLDVTVIVNDASVGGAIDAQKALSFSVTDVIESYIGNGSANTLVGTASDETFIGNGGADKMTGGGGRDTFVFKALTDTAAGSPSFITNPTIAWQSGLGLRDVITDFTPGFDKIDLSLIDASTKLSGNQAFAFNGTGAFSSNPGSLIYRVFDLAGTANDRTIVYADVNGDRLADMQIELTGLKTLQATDFVL